MGLGETEIQQLNASGLARSLEELQSRGNAVGAQWCAACRIPSVVSTCEAYARRTSTIRTADATMVQLVMPTRCASFGNIELFE